MKDLIRKILKEEQDEFEWAKGLDMSAAEKEIKKPWKDAEYEYSIDMLDIYDHLVTTGYTDIDNLKQLGEELYRKIQQSNEYGYDSGRESCDCDGCCDDYYYEDQVHEMTSDARQEGDTEGYERGREESQDEIDELKGQISELQDTIEELRSRLSS
jgi:polyhydroxyalkanoate synthesis regulator phasin